MHHLSAINRCKETNQICIHLGEREHSTYALETHRISECSVQLLNQVLITHTHKTRIETYLQRGTLHSDSLQARAWSCKRYHILLHRLQPPEARTLHVMPCRNSPFTLLHLGY